jgi:hypothetical protein
MLSQQDHDELIRLEHTLWRADTRFNRAYMDSVLAPDFFEFGRSGRTYKRQDTLDASGRGEIRATLKGIAVTEIVEGVALVTYVSEVLYEELEIGNRSSLWSRSAKGWQLRFHQGTMVNR